jgi:hypothetical protein
MGMVQECSGCFRMVQDGSEWFGMVQDDQGWFTLWFVLAFTLPAMVNNFLSPHFFYSTV